MKNKTIFAGILVIVVIASIYLVWRYIDHIDYTEKTLHDTNRWVVILDSHEDIIAVETINEVWSTLVNLYQNRSEMWVGGIVEEYGNKWGFRFKPDTIIIAQITIEGAQSNIQGISENLNYWIATWGKEVYVLAKIVEIHK